MVVVSCNWAKNIASYPSVNSSSDVVVSNDNMAAKAILICRPNSHHFQERTLTLDQPVKVGRSVARAKPTATNAIFDCKVLSRHHAVLWYDNGKFYLQDTKSSNGTFVNNHKLAPETENNELCSGDIVQFGVDVVENNRKVTHGCIIAKIKLFLPDGKEAKASDEGRQGMVPLDDLYRLNQIIQEANQREQCLETKLTALKQVVDETRKSAAESWQAYVGEERLLSRLSALENQLHQASKNWSEDRLRDELAKLQEENEAYQVAAKEALEKLHTEKLQAVALAMEQERAKITAEEEALLAKQQFLQAQLDLEVVARKLTQQQTEAEEYKLKVEQHEQELEAKLESESGKLLDLQIKLRELNALSIQDFESLGFLENSGGKLIYNDDVKCKEELLAENEVSESMLNTSNGLDNHISLTVAPVEEENESEKRLETSNQEETMEDNEKSDAKKVTLKIPDEAGDKEDDNESHDESDITENEWDSKKNDDQVDSKTLKYQFQSVQNELKRKIDMLESIAEANKFKISELNKALDEEKEISQKYLVESEILKQELILYQQKWKESCNENQQHQDSIAYLNSELETTQMKLKEICESTREKQRDEDTGREKSVISSKLVTLDQLLNLEEELVLIKERFAQVNEEKLKLQRDLLHLTEQYNIVCNRSYNKYFFYVAPLVFMVLYLLVSAMIS